MRTNRIATVLAVIVLAMLVLPGATLADQGKRLEKSKRPYADVKVILYMTDWCPYSKQARALLQDMGVNLIMYNVEKNPAKGREMIEKSGKSSVPFVDVEGTYIPGFYEKAIKEAIEKAREQ
jgi:glutaredoxin 3